MLSTRVREGGPARLEIEAALVRVVAGPGKGLEVPLGADSLLLGSSSECGLVLDDPTVSARHAEIRLERGRYVLRDLGSKNGVLLGEWPVERVVLCDRMQLALGRSRLVVRATGGRAEIALARPGAFGGLCARSVKMRAVVAALEALAATDTTVLIEGETGTGKEVAAQALHDAGPRAGGPFVVLDCGALAPTLVAAELFGHERGAYSGAAEPRAGLLEQAHGGTLFCDEIGELPLEVQPLFLRALERKSVRRLGGSRERACDVRVVAATHRNLSEEARLGHFRRDLYYRLAVARVRLPPLRERPEDLPVLAQTFAAEQGAPLEPELLVLLAAYGWPGNVRELRNVIARLAARPGEREGLFGTGELVRPEDPILDGVALRPLGEARERAGQAFERRYLLAALERAGGNISRAAAQAGVSRQLFPRLCARHRLRERDREPG